ncbi:MAG: DUF4239 domain-containing protein [Candidatus Contendobacter sp.]|mgnify:CR=1 FL=1|jgi:hypothetical protein|nr:DUF4239 domain-containing protein [Gammaproteobacteria bacterium]MCC8994710.1 DUF4239 domain-containing protein [Candidatus Contendobacter sp.]
MIETWLNFPLWLTIPMTLLFWLVTAAGVWGVFQYPRLVPFWQKCTGIAPPYVSIFAALFGLSVSFMGADIWQRTERAQKDVFQEVSQLNYLLHLAEAIGPAGQTMTVPICAYAKTVVQEEWPVMLLHGEASPVAQAAFYRLLSLLTAPEFTAQVDATVRREMLNAVNQSREYRIDRIQLSSNYSHFGKWVMVLFLGFMTQIAIGVVHLDKPRARAVTLFIFTMAMAVTLILLAGLDQPFASPFAVSNDPFVQLASCH